MAIAIIIISIAVGMMKRFDLVPMLVIGMLFIFVIEVFSPGVEIDLSFQPIFLSSGQNLITIFTSMFVHESFLHVITNMLFLYLIGVPLEARVGKVRFAIFYFVAGLVGLMVETLVVSGSPYVMILGASAAISGAMGAMLLLYPMLCIIPFFIGILFLPRVPVWLSVGSWFGVEVLFAFTEPNGGVAYAAHVGGFVTGMALAWAMSTQIRRADKERAGSVEPIDTSQLEPLATTPQLRNALEHIRGENHPDVRKAWLEYFAEHACCPKCGSRLRSKGRSIKCDCGFIIDIK